MSELGNPSNELLDSNKSLFNAVAIVVNWNGGALLPRCIDSLLMQSIPFRQIVVIDNNSADGSADTIDAMSSQVKLVRSPTNLGFAAGCNLGVSVAESTEWFAFINVDALLATDWLEQIACVCEPYGNFQFFASRQLMAQKPDVLDGAGDNYHVNGLHWRRGYGHCADSHLILGEVFGACGAVALYSADVFRDEGGFDERFFCYAEDVDLAFRLRLKGYRCCYVPAAVAHHVGSAITGKHSDFTIYHGHRNLEWVFFKNMPSLLLWMYLPQHVLLNVITILWFTLRGRGRVIVRAKWDAIKGLPRVLRERKEIQSSRKASTRELRRVMVKGLLAPYLRRLK